MSFLEDLFESLISEFGDDSVETVEFVLEDAWYERAWNWLKRSKPKSDQNYLKDKF